jgi:hypothetical protein
MALLQTAQKIKTGQQALATITMALIRTASLPSEYYFSTKVIAPKFNVGRQVIGKTGPDENEGDCC